MQVFRPTGVLNRFTELRHSKVKYKHIFYKASSPPSPSSLLKLPTVVVVVVVVVAVAVAVAVVVVVVVNNQQQHFQRQSNAKLNQISDITLLLQQSDQKIYI